MTVQKGLVETELQGVTGICQDPGESDEEYRFRLLHLTNEALPKCWGELSSFTQQYYNDSVSGLSESKNVPAFPVHPDDITGDDMSTETMTPRTTSGQFAKKTTDVAPAAEPDATSGDVEAAATALAAANAPVIGVATKDTYGLRLGTLSSRAAEMFTKGAKMAEVKKETGINHYNLLRKLEASGHIVTREDAVITLTRGGDIAGDGGSASEPA